MNHIIRTAAVLACAVSLCAAPCTAYAAKTANSAVGPGQAASVETNYHKDTMPSPTIPRFLNSFVIFALSSSRSGNCS